MKPCVFCLIAAGNGTAPIVREWPDAIAFVPLHPVRLEPDPVTPGHTVVIPRLHVADLGVDPLITAVVMYRAAELGAALRAERGADLNLITSAGPAATQTVTHLHLHLVPRTAGDGLALPWPMPVGAR